jgi:serine protease Do
MGRKAVALGWFVVLTLTLAWGQKSAPQAGTVPSNQPGTNILAEYDRALNRVAERAMLSVVEIDVSGYGPPEKASDSQIIERQRGVGSGVIVDPSGYIMTNNHVVSGAQRIRVILSPATLEMNTRGESMVRRQRTYAAKLVGTSRFADLALIKIDAQELPTIPLPANFLVRLGQSVLAIGTPEGLDHTLTKGIVSAIGRQPESDNPMVYIQTDAPINPGNSGGPLIDGEGNLVGINTFIFTQGGGSEGLGFAIPQPIVRFVYEELRAHGRVRRTEIGANVQTITPDLAAGLKLPQDWGVILSDVVPGGPAEKAGLRRKDVVISVDGRRVDSLPRFGAFLYLHKRDQPIPMQVLRGAQTLNISVIPADVRLGADSLADLIRPETDLISPLGIFVVALNDDVVDLLPGVRSKSGLVVAGTLESEPPVYAELTVGDVIRTFNENPVTSPDQLRSALGRLKPGDSAVLEVERQGILRYVAFEME